MSLTGRPPYQKTGGSLKKKPNKPRADHRERWSRIVELGCILTYFDVTNCSGRITIHHLYTGAGGRKDHEKVAGLCLNHHLQDEGVNSLTGKISRREWEAKYATERELEEKTKELLGEI